MEAFPHTCVSALGPHHLRDGALQLGGSAEGIVMAETLASSLCPLSAAATPSL